jgi:phosphoglycolate phosphatase-like HAD superfamily hydrolase
MKIFGTDYDGVVINIEPQKAAAFGQLINRSWNVNKDEAADFWIKGGGTSRRSKFDYFYSQQYGKQLENEDYKHIEKKYSTLLKTKYYPKTKLLSGALKLIKYARSHFNFTFISSGVPMEELHYLTNLNGVSGYFDLILGTNEIYTSKHVHFSKIIREQKSRSIVFVADGLEDMRVAKEFGAMSIGISTNLSKASLKSVGANKTCSDLYEALLILKSFNT